MPRRGNTGYTSLIIPLKRETKRGWTVALRRGESDHPDEKYNRL